MKICPHCGTSCRNDQKYCENCGAPLPAAGASRAYAGGSAGDRSAPFSDSRDIPPQDRVIYTDIIPHSIPVSIILCIVTCGIYGLYWMYRLNNEINEMAEDIQAPEGLLVIIFTVISCGIYGLYWFYQMGRKCDYISGVDSSSSVLYLVFALFGLGIIPMALMQDTINKALQ